MEQHADDCESGQAEHTGPRIDITRLFLNLHHYQLTQQMTHRQRRQQQKQKQQQEDVQAFMMGSDAYEAMGATVEMKHAPWTSVPSGDRDADANGFCYPQSRTAGDRDGDVGEGDMCTWWHAAQRVRARGARVSFVLRVERAAGVPWNLLLTLSSLVLLLVLPIVLTR